MDAELLKCKRTHEALTYRFKQSQRLLHLMCYLNDSDCKDDDFMDLKRRCADKLSLLNNKSLPKHNIAFFGLDSCNLSLYHQCVRTDKQQRENVPSEYKQTVEDWRRLVLGLNEDETVGDIHNSFCKIAGFICYPKLAMDETMTDFICPLCILTDAYADIGWTDYVCPRPASEAPSVVVSKRGVDKSLPAGACEHLMTVRTTRYDRLFE